MRAALKFCNLDQILNRCINASLLEKIFSNASNRVSALYEPNDQLSIRLNADYHEVDENGAGTVVLNNGPLPIGPGVFLPIAVATLNDDFFAVSDQRPFDPRQEANEFLSLIHI